MKKNKIIIIICFLFLVLFIGVNIYFYKAPYKSNKQYYVDKDGQSIHLEEGDSYSGKFKIYSDEVDNLHFYINDTNTNGVSIANNKLYVKIYDENHNLIYSDIFSSLSQSHNEIFLLEPLINHDKDEYYIEFYLEKCGGDINVLMTHDGYVAIDMMILQKNNIFSLFSYLFIFIDSIILFINLFIIINNTKDYKNKFSCFLSYICFYFISMVISCFTFVIFYKIYFGVLSLTLNLIYILSLIIYALYVSYKIKITKKSIESLFLLVAIPIVSIMIFVIMPGDCYDEYAHYATAYRYSELKFNREIPVEVPSIILETEGPGNAGKLAELLYTEYSYNETKNVRESNYNPIYYIFASVAIFIGRCLNLNPYIGWYLAKIFNSIIYLLISYYLVKHSKKYKLGFSLLVLCPMFLYLAVSITIDMYINMAGLVLLSLALNKNIEPSKFSIKDIVTIAVCSIFLCFSKYVYIPIILLSLIIMRKSLKLYGKKSILIILMVLAILFSSFIINGIISFSKSGGSTTFLLLNGGGRIDYIIRHPLRLIEALYKYFIIEEIDIWIFNSIGYSFTWALTVMPRALPVFMLIIILLAFVYDDESGKLDIISFISSLFTFVIIACFLFCAIYCFESRSRPFVEYVYGLQGRYFILPNVLLLLPLGNFKLVTKNINNGIFIAYLCCFALYLIFFVRCLMF